MNADSCFGQWERLSAELAQTRSLAAACLRNPGPHAAWETLRLHLAGGEGAPLARFTSSGSMEIDGPALEHYLSSIQAALRALEERLCMLRSSLAELAEAGEIPASRDYAREMKRHLQHRKGERDAVLRLLRFRLGASATLLAADRDAVRAEIARVQALPHATLLRDRQCLLSPLSRR